MKKFVFVLLIFIAGVSFCEEIDYADIWNNMEYKDMQDFLGGFFNGLLSAMDIMELMAFDKYAAGETKELDRSGAQYLRDFYTEINRGGSDMTLFYIESGMYDFYADEKNKHVSLSSALTRVLLSMLDE